MTKNKCILGILFLCFIVVLNIKVVLSAPKWTTIEESISKASHWGGKKLITKAKRVLKLWYPYIWQYGGGRDPMYWATLIMTETAHTSNPFAHTLDEKLGECGLLSLKRELAKKYNVNCCDPASNIWAKARFHHEQTKQVHERYKNLNFYKKLDYVDRLKFYSMFGTYPCLRNDSGAIKQALTAKKYPKTSPFENMFNWIKQMDETLKDPMFDYCWGRTDATTAVFRSLRVIGKTNMLIHAYGGGKKGRKRLEQCIIPINRIDISNKPDTHYPGDDGHGICCEKDLWQPSSKGKTCWHKWNMPTSHRKKRKKGKLIDLWQDYCDIDDKTCTYSDINDKWFNQKQEQGILPSKEEYELAEKQMRAAGCWLFD